jgi:hypothetical protein
MLINAGNNESREAMKQYQRAIVRSITDKQTASAKCPGGKKIGLVLPGGQPLYTDKKNIGDKKVEIGGDRFLFTLSSCLL